MKQKYNVYRVIEFDNGAGDRKMLREFAGTTWAISEAKARANVEYRIHGKALYQGGFVKDMGQENSIEVYYEAEKLEVAL